MRGEVRKEKEEENEEMYKKEERGPIKEKKLEEGMNSKD